MSPILCDLTIYFSFKYNLKKGSVHLTKNLYLEDTPFHMWMQKTEHLQNTFIMLYIFLGLSLRRTVEIID